MKLTSVEISAIYESLAAMRVELDPSPHRGLQYVKERLTLCRAMRDRAGEVLLQCSRALRDVRAEELALKMEHRLAPTTMLEQRIAQVGGEKADHDLLCKMVKVQYMLLGNTAQDIRLLASLTTEQIKLGEIDPKDAGLVETASIVDASPIDSKTVGGENVVTSGVGLATLIEVPGSAPNEPEDAAIDYDDLLGDTHGQFTPRVL